MDTGIGIPENKLQNIFESFTQASSDTARKYGGTGLGLTISKQLIEQQGGEISVVSKINEGSVFSFTLILEAAEPENIIYTEEEEQSYTGLTGVKVLLVEDNDMNQLIVKKILKKWNMQFDIAENGRIAVKKILQNNYDLILMDLQMPEMDGYETIAYIRSQMQMPKSKIPVIAMTANVIVGEAERCMAAGMNDYISKPFVRKLLYEKMRRVLTGNKNAASEKETPGTIKIQKPSENKTCINLDYLREASDGSLDFMNEVFEMFMRQTPVMLHDMNEHLKNGQWPELGKLAHKIKPTFTYLGMKKGNKIAAAIEKKAKGKKDIDKIPDLFLQLSAQCKQAIQEIETEIKKINNESYHNRG